MILPLDDEPSKRSGSKPKGSKKKGAGTSETIVKGVTGESLAIRRAPDMAAVKQQLQVAKAVKFGGVFKPDPEF